jgi:hypothetical protein
MTDDNTIDIRDRLPPIEVRKPWRQKLPHCYAKRVDDLVAIREQIRTIQSHLGAMHREFCELEVRLGRVRGGFP